MHNQTGPTDKKSELFFYLLFLTGFFVLLEISFFIQCNQTYFADFFYVSERIAIPNAILPGLLFFLVTQLALHFAYCLLTFYATDLVANFFNLSSTRKLILGIGWWILGLMLVLAANQFLFPNSKFADLTLIVFPKEYIKIILTLLLSLYGMTIFVATFALLKVLVEKNWLSSVLLISFFMGVFYYFYHHKTDPILPIKVEQPNIIIIGVDSLRPDFLGFFGHRNRTPFLDSFLKQATVFNQAITPAARTFPSWGSILTGMHPKMTGIRFDLAKQNNINTENTLSNVLKRHGYKTIFATDETRFSNIDKNFGFDEIVSPPMGLNDFLLGTFNDFPLSNLLVNTRVGKWLFPYSYGNRAAFFTYQPNTFLELLKPALANPADKPLFLAVHFCLPHFPYLWADSKETNEASNRYAASLDAVDVQLKNFFAILDNQGLLKHSIVVLLSDHGEALGLPGDRITERAAYLSSKHHHLGSVPPKFYPPSVEEEDFNQSAGHGTDVLGLAQFRVLLAFKIYGNKTQKVDLIPGIVSLMDIKDTVLQLIGLEPGKYSLASVIYGEDRVTNNRHLFLESDYSPQSIRTVFPKTREVMLEGIELFQINPNNMRLTFKDTMGLMIIKSKQYADIYGDWMLALYPQNQTERMPILVHLKTGKWTNDLESAFAKRSPAQEMLQALKSFYGNEIN